MPQQKITLSDDRPVYRYQVDVIMVSHWLPILGYTGFALYNLYVCLTAKAGVAQLGIRSIYHFVGCSRNTVYFNNKLMELSGLIAIESGKPDTPNEYHILAPPTPTPDLLYTIRQAAQNDPLYINQKRGQRFLRELLARIDKWRPLDIDSLTGPQVARPVAAANGQLNLLQTKDLQALIGLGIGQPRAMELLQLVPPLAPDDFVQRWVRWMSHKLVNDPGGIAHPSRYLEQCFAKGDYPPHIPNANDQGKGSNEEEDRFYSY